MQNRPRIFILAYLLLALLASAWYAHTEWPTAMAGTIPEGTTHVTIYAYDDANDNGWRDVDEAPFLPQFDVNITLMYRFISADCDNVESGWFLLVDGADNVIALQRACEYDTLSRPFGDDTTASRYVGSFVTDVAEMTIYVPTTGTPGNLLGTPTPRATTATPSVTPTSTTDPVNLLTPTPTPQPTPSPTPTSTRPGLIERHRALLPLVQSD